MSVLEDWEKDCILTDNFDDESQKISELHSKYLRILYLYRIKYKTMIQQKKIVEQKLEDYYLGKIDGKDLNRPAHQIVETRASALKRVETDSEMISVVEKIDKIEETILLLKEILESIKQRSFNIRNAIEWRKFTNGNL